MGLASAQNILSFPDILSLPDQVRSCRSSVRDEGEGPLRSLEGLAISSRFCAWRGASDRRYVASVYPMDRLASDDGLPAFESFVLIAVASGPLGRRILGVSAIERENDRAAGISFGLARGADEWHVHLLAADRRERAAIVEDLQSRHDEAGTARCA